MDSFVPLPTGGSGPQLDSERQTKNGQVVETQRIQAYAPDVVGGSITRPPDATAYTIGDSVSNSTTAPTATEFQVARFPGGGGVITGAHFIDDSNPTTKPKLELWLFGGATPPTPTNDNIAIAWSDPDLANLIGVIEFLDTEVRVGNPAAGASGNSVCTGRCGTSHVFELPFRCNVATQSIWGMVVVRTGYTPANAGILRFNLHVRRE